MLGQKEAVEVIRQLSEEAFLCNDDTISTNDYVIVKKSKEIPDDKLMKAINEIKKANSIR